MTINGAIATADRATDSISSERVRAAIKLLIAVARVAISRGIVDGSRDYEGEGGQRDA